MGSLPALRSGHIRLSPHMAGNEGLPPPGPYKVGSGSLLLWRMRARPLEGCGKQRASASLTWPSNPFGNWPQPACSVYVRRLGILLSPHPGHTSMNLKGSPHLPAKPAFQSLAQVSPPPCRRAPSWDHQVSVSVPWPFASVGLLKRRAIVIHNLEPLVPMEPGTEGLSRCG